MCYVILVVERIIELQKSVDSVIGTPRLGGPASLKTTHEMLAPNMEWLPCYTLVDMGLM